MARIKKETISTSHFEKEIIKVIKTVENLEKVDKGRVLCLLRSLYNNCLEYEDVGIPTDRALEISAMLKEKGYKKNEEVQ